MKTAASNRDLLHELLTGTAETPEFWMSAFNESGSTFVAGSLTFSENLHDFIVFLTIARGIADYLAPQGHGLAIIHNFLWGSTTTIGMRMMPSGESHILPELECRNVVPAFQPIADALIDGRLPEAFPMRDQLRLLG